MRHDNGLVFGSRACRALVRDYGLTQEYIAPYTPEQNGLCERFIRTFKEECNWQHRFDSLTAPRATVSRYIEHYNIQHTHSALKYNTPRQTYLTLCPPPFKLPLQLHDHRQLKTPAPSLFIFHIYSNLP